MDWYQRTRMTAGEEALEEAVEERRETSIHIESPWHVILFNDHVHAFDEVILQLVKATGCGLPRAAEVAVEAHTVGRSGAFSGELEACLGVQSILGEIGLLTELAG
jgi:ATP-dependent Clp protease adaptor protein ClpS